MLKWTVLKGTGVTAEMVRGDGVGCQEQLLVGGAEAVENEADKPSVAHVVHVLRSIAPCESTSTPIPNTGAVDRANRLARLCQKPSQCVEVLLVGHTPASTSARSQAGARPRSRRGGCRCGCAGGRGRGRARRAGLRATPIGQHGERMRTSENRRCGPVVLGANDGEWGGGATEVAGGEADHGEDDHAHGGSACELQSDLADRHVLHLRHVDLWHAQGRAHMVRRSADSRDDPTPRQTVAELGSRWVGAAIAPWRDRR